MSEDRERLAAALEPARRAFGLASQSDPAAQQLGMVLFRERPYDQAISVSADGLAISPFNADLHYITGCAFVSVGRNAEAISQLELVTRLRPNWAEGRCQLALAFELAGRTADAIKQYNDALRLKPDYAEALDHLARIRAEDR